MSKETIVAGSAVAANMGESQYSAPAVVLMYVIAKC
jgi:hypothetical protein